MLDCDFFTLADIDDDARLLLRENADLTTFLLWLKHEAFMLLADHKRFSVYVRTDLNDRRFFGKLECFFYIVEYFVFLLVFATLFFAD